MLRVVPASSNFAAEYQAPESYLKSKFPLFFFAVIGTTVVSIGAKQTCLDAQRDYEGATSRLSPRAKEG